MLSRFLSDCQSLTLNVVILNLSGLVNCVTKSLREAIKRNVFLESFLNKGGVWDSYSCEILVTFSCTKTPRNAIKCVVVEGGSCLIIS